MVLRRFITGVTFCLSLSTNVFAQAEYPGALWVPANSGNYTVSNRPISYPIVFIVIHVTQGSYSGAINWFQNAASNVAAHYVTRSSDGQITQMVKHKDIGYHAGNWTYNTQSVGIEHEGFVNDPNWFTPEMYRSSAALSRWITAQHGIPRDRNHIIGHVEVPGATHTDPGPHWNWNLYMDLIQLNSSLFSSDVPTMMMPGSTADVTVLFQNVGEATWFSSNPGQTRLATANPWGRSSPFFTSGQWISPSQVVPPDFTTYPGGIGEFHFRLTAPETSGSYVESFQLMKDGVGAYGPTISFPIIVPDVDVIVDNVDKGFSVKGFWQTGVTAPGHYGADYRFATSMDAESAVAVWELEGGPVRDYDVYVWWSQGTNRSDAAKYRLIHGGGMRPTTVIVNQQTNGGQWNLIGQLRGGPRGGRVELSNQGPLGKVVIADAVRFVRR